MAFELPLWLHSNHGFLDSIPNWPLLPPHQSWATLLYSKDERSMQFSGNWIIRGTSHVAHLKAKVLHVLSNHPTAEKTQWWKTHIPTMIQCHEPFPWNNVTTHTTPNPEKIPTTLTENACWHVVLHPNDYSTTWLHFKSHTVLHNSLANKCPTVVKRYSSRSSILTSATSPTTQKKTLPLQMTQTPLSKEPLSKEHPASWPSAWLPLPHPHETSPMYWPPPPPQSSPLNAMVRELPSKWEKSLPQIGKSYSIEVLYKLGFLMGVT